MTISSVAVIVLIAIEVFLSGFIAYYEATHPDHNPHSVTAYLEFAHKAIRNLGPLLLVVVGIIHERSKDIDRVNMRLFVGMIVLFVLTLAAAIVLASFTWLIWAHLGLDLGNVWFLLTTLFYFQFVLKG